MHVDEEEPTFESRDDWRTGAIDFSTVRKSGDSVKVVLISEERSDAAIKKYLQSAYESSGGTYDHGPIVGGCRGLDDRTAAVAKHKPFIAEWEHRQGAGTPGRDRSRPRLSWTERYPGSDDADVPSAAVSGFSRLNADRAAATAAARSSADGSIPGYEPMTRESDFFVETAD